MFVDRMAVARTVVGAGLKSIGSVARIQDIPQEQKALRSQAIQREAILVGSIFAASLALEFLLGRFLKRKNEFIKFIPQAIAYTLAEWVSRKLSTYDEILKSSLRVPQPQQPKDTFVKQALAVDDDDEDDIQAVRRFSPSLARPSYLPEPSVNFAQGQRAYYQQPAQMRGFY